MLKVREIVKILDAEILAGEDQLDMEIYSGCGADLMSDVMAFVKESVILCTAPRTKPHRCIQYRATV